MHGLLRRNPIERISFEEFFSHPFLIDGPKPLGLPALHLPVPPTSHAPSASHTANHANPHRRAPSPLPQQQTPDRLSPVAEFALGQREGQIREDGGIGGGNPGCATGGLHNQQQHQGQHDQDQRMQQQQGTDQQQRLGQQGGEQRYGQNAQGMGGAGEIGIAVQGSRSPSPHSIAAAAGMQQQSPALYGAMHSTGAGAGQDSSTSAMVRIEEKSDV